MTKRVQQNFTNRLDIGTITLTRDRPDLTKIVQYVTLRSGSISGAGLCNEIGNAALSDSQSVCYWRSTLGRRYRLAAQRDRSIVCNTCWPLQTY